MGSRWRKRQPEKLVWPRVWPTARWDDWWQLNGGSVDQERRRRVWAVPGIAARYREELGNPTRRPCIVCAPVPAANEGWLAHRWCDRSASGGRSALPPRSALTGVGAGGRLGCRPRCCRSPAEEQRPVSETWSLARTDGSGGVDAAQRNSDYDRPNTNKQAHHISLPLNCVSAFPAVYYC